MQRKRHLPNMRNLRSLPNLFEQTFGSKSAFSENADEAVFANVAEFANFVEYIEKEVKAAPRNKESEQYKHQVIYTNS
jgi:hypothetical protein